MLAAAASPCDPAVPGAQRSRSFAAYISLFDWKVRGGG
jgi:hypothetical protein